MINSPATQQERRAGWIRGWTEEHIKRVFDGKLANDAWRSDPAYQVVVDHCGDAKGVLDVGCGGGVQYAAFKAFAPGVLYRGIDIHPGMVAYARERFAWYRFDEGDATNLHFGANYFDVVVLRQVLEHYKPPYVRLILREAKRVAHRGVVILFRVVTEDLGTEPVRLDKRGQFDYNHYGRRWFQSQLEALGDGTKAIVRRQEVPWVDGSVALGDQEVWSAFWR